MKKKVIPVVIIILLIIVCDYVLIPNIVELKSSTTIKVTQDGLHRMLLNKKSVAKWWPGKVANECF